MSGVNWAALEAISTAVSTIVVIVALIIAYREFREIERTRSLESLLEAIRSLTSEDLSKSRDYILTKELPPAEEVSRENTPDIYEHMHKVWVSFDNLGLMVHFRMLPENIALPMFYGQAVKCWNKLERYIKYKDDTRPQEYQVYFKEFYDLSCQYALKLAEQKESEAEEEHKKGNVGQARVLLLEAQEMYKDLRLNRNIEVVHKRIDPLRQIVFLDRDGTLNDDDCVTYKKKQFQLIKGVKEGLMLLKTWGFEFVIVSNQSGIGRGDYKVKKMMKFNELLYNALFPVEIKPEDFYYCPHDPNTQECDCHKPNPKMLIEAAKDRDVNVEQSYIIGDKLSDMMAGRNAGCKTTILVKTGITDDVDEYDVEPDYVVENLVKAAQLIGKLEGIE